jgi:hypothetical protein
VEDVFGGDQKGRLYSRPSVAPPEDPPRVAPRRAAPRRAAPPAAVTFSHSTAGNPPFSGRAPCLFCPEERGCRFGPPLQSNLTLDVMTPKRQPVRPPAPRIDGQPHQQQRRRSMVPSETAQRSAGQTGGDGNGSTFGNVSDAPRKNWLETSLPLDIFWFGVANLAKRSAVWALVFAIVKMVRKATQQPASDDYCFAFRGSGVFLAVSHGGGFEFEFENETTTTMPDDVDLSVASRDGSPICLRTMFELLTHLGDPDLEFSIGLE